MPCPLWPSNKVLKPNFWSIISQTNNGCSLLSFILAKLLLLDISCENIFTLFTVTALTACPFSINVFAKMSVFYVKTAKNRWRLKFVQRYKMFQIQSIYSENAYGLRTGYKLRTGSQPGGCRPLIDNNVVSRYFSKMLFAEKSGKFSAFTFLNLLKKSYRNIE